VVPHGGKMMGISGKKEFMVIGKEEGCYFKGQAALIMAKKIGAGHKAKGSFTS